MRILRPGNQIFKFNNHTRKYQNVLKKSCKFLIVRNLKFFKTFKKNQTSLIFINVL